MRAYNASVEGFLAQACVAHVQGKRKESARGFAAKTALALALLPSTSATDGNFAVSGMTRESMRSSPCRSSQQIKPSQRYSRRLKPPTSRSSAWLTFSSAPACLLCAPSDKDMRGLNNSDCRFSEARPNREPLACPASSSGGMRRISSAYSVIAAKGAPTIPRLPHAHHAPSTRNSSSQQKRLKWIP